MKLVHYAIFQPIYILLTPYVCDGIYDPRHWLTLLNIRSFRCRQSPPIWWPMKKCITGNKIPDCGRRINLCVWPLYNVGMQEGRSLDLDMNANRRTKMEIKKVMSRWSLLYPTAWEESAKSKPEKGVANRRCIYAAALDLGRHILTLPRDWTTILRMPRTNSNTT